MTTRLTKIPAILITLPTAALAQVASDTAGSGQRAALTWAQGTLLGNLACAVAALAIAVLGLVVLSRRAKWRSDATAIVGCVVPIGAGALASASAAVAAFTR